MAEANVAPRTAAEIEAELAGLDFTPADDTPDTPDAGVSDDAAALEAELADYEDRATRQGWVPRDKYRGDQKKWVDAKTFVERGDRFVVNLQSEVATLRKEIEDFKGTKAAFVKFHEETVARKDAELKEAIDALRVQRSEAQYQGEHDQVVAIEDRIELLKDQRKELKQPVVQDSTSTSASSQQQAVDMNNPVLLEWIEDGNQWFQDEPKLRDYAIAIGTHLLSNGETVRGRGFLDKISEAMRKEFPRRFKTASGNGDNLANAASGSGNSSGTGAGGKPSGSHGKTERDLPPEDQALMKQFIAAGWTTKQKFLDSYFSNNR